VDAIRASGLFTDAALIAAAIERDPGFDVPMFVRQLTGARRINSRDVARYGIDATALAAVQERCAAWAAKLRDPASSGDSRPG
jgi:hypothetical protein